MKQLSGSAKRHLIKLAHDLKPILHVGKNGVSSNLIAAIDKTLMNHELIKVKFLDHKSERKELSMAIAEKTGSELLRVIGNTAIFYKESRDSSKRQKLVKEKRLPKPRNTWKPRRTPRG